MWDKIISGFVIIITASVFKDILYKWAKLVQYYYKHYVNFFFMMFNSLILMPMFLWNGKHVKNALLMSEVSKHVTKLLNVTWELRNPEIVSEDRAAVIILNHQSSLDLLGLCNFWYIWKKVSCVIKKEFIYYFPFGLGLYLMDAIFVDRRNPKDAHRLLQEKSKTRLQDKIKILIFPEGRRSSDYTKLLPFKKGAFNIAVGAQVPIIPVVISRYYFINNKKHIFNGGHVIAQCLEPVSTEGLTMDDVPELINTVHSSMERVFKELSKEVISSLPPDYPLETLTEESKLNAK